MLLNIGFYHNDQFCCVENHSYIIFLIALLVTVFTVALKGDVLQLLENKIYSIYKYLSRQNSFSLINIFRIAVQYLL